MPSTDLVSAGDYPPTNRRADVFGISLLRVREGRLAEEVIAVDGLSLLLQLGFTVAPPAAPPSW